MPDGYNGPEFLRRLKDGDLHAPLVCEGFAKPVEGSGEAFQFAPAGVCNAWTKIPIELVERVEILGDQPCRDHSHPLVRVHFKEPSAQDTAAGVFASLLRTTTHQLMIIVGRQGGLQSWIDDVIDASNVILGNDDPPDMNNPALNRGALALWKKCHGIYPYGGLSPKARQNACDLLNSL